MDPSVGSLKTVSGIWRGAYRRDPSELSPARVPVPFTLTLKQGWFGRFTGSVVDDAALGMPGVGKIEGRFSYPKVSFVKRMPVACVGMRDGRLLTIREWMKEYSLPLERDIAHAPIYYVGDFADTTHARGTWAILPHPLELDDGRIVKMPGGTGVWDLEAA